jgi:branched-chain amino acid aminotransferase
LRLCQGVKGVEALTRDSSLQVCRDKGYEVVEKRVTVDELLSCDEAFTVGTAVVVSPIGEVHYADKVKKWDFNGGGGPVTSQV